MALPSAQTARRGIAGFRGSVCGVKAGLLSGGLTSGRCLTTESCTSCSVAQVSCRVPAPRHVNTCQQLSGRQCRLLSVVLKPLTPALEVLTAGRSDCGFSVCQIAGFRVVAVVVVVAFYLITRTTSHHFKKKHTLLKHPEAHAGDEGVKGSGG